MQPKATVAYILDNFLARTQITWISYVSTRHGIWRLAWIFVILTGISISVIQSWKAMLGYSGFDVSLQTTFLLNATLPFPAVTICSNSPINWLIEEQSNSTFYQEITAKLRDEQEKAKHDMKYQKKGKSYEEYVLFDVLRKYVLPPTDYGVVSNVLWNGTYYAANGPSGSGFQDLEMKGIVKRAHDLYYGDCVTFNAGVDNETMIDASALTGIEFILDWDVKDRYPFMNDPAIILTVHPMGTAPVLSDGNNIKVYPKDEVAIGVKEACINTCIQKLSLDICSCWDYQIPLGHLQNVHMEAIICPSRCSKIDGVLNLKLCRCHLPCEEIIMDISTSIKSNLIEEILTSEASCEDGVNITTTKTRVKVFLKTSMFEYSNEVPKYTVAEFWGIVGGNAAFWIGISAVSLFEIIELAMNLAHMLLKQMYEFLKSFGRMKSGSKDNEHVKVKRRKPIENIPRPLNHKNRFTYTYETVPPLFVDDDLSLKPYYHSENYGMYLVDNAIKKL